MKKIIYLLSCISVLISCTRNEIEIQKNTDTSWEIDKKIQEEDIRGRIGYDPRYEYVYTAVSEIDMPMLSLMDFKITDKNTSQVQVKLSKPIEQDVQVSLEYDASLFERFKTNYSGYQLGESSLIEIVSPEQSLAKGTTLVTFDIKVLNQEKFDKKLIIPLAIKVNGSDWVKPLDKKDYVLIKIFAQEINFKVDGTVTKQATLEGGIAKMTNKKVNVDIAISTPITTSISLGLVRDNSLAMGKTLAPDNIEGTITKIDFQNKTNGTISFELQNIEKLTTEGDYLLPLKLVAYDSANKEYIIPTTPILVTIKVNELVGIPSDNEIEEINDTKEPLLSGYKFVSNYQSGHLYKLSDKKNNTGNWWIDTNLDDLVYLQATFTKPTLIKGIKITQLTSNKQISSMYIAASDEDDYEIQGMYIKSNGSVKNVLYLSFKKPIMAKNILFYDFKNTKDRYIDIHEVEFF